MLKYTRGYVSSKIIKEMKTLVIELSGCSYDCENCKNKYRKNDGQNLTDNFTQIMSTFAGFIDAVCFVGGQNDQLEVNDLCKRVKEKKLKTCYSTIAEGLDFLNKNLLSNLDYVKIGRCDKKQTLHMKDYSPFGDVEDWIECMDVQKST